MINLPDKNNEEITIECKPVKDGYVVYTGVEKSTNAHSCLIFEIKAATKKGIANDIARIITMARDIGFEQGRRSIRKALGIE